MLVNAREVLVRPDLLAGVDDGPLEDIVPTAVRAGGFSIGREPPEERAGRKRWRASSMLDGKEREAAIVVWRCPDERAAAIYVVSMRGAPVAEGVELALTGRCLGPDEKGPSCPMEKPW